ncbi:anthrone oxygenase family protein [Quadrisphaera oryzae]|uniref:anthrone oxygenase family protein n=1 Tax=Quadrisphaera TaxID=317661 RepID=UPI0016471B60|nr:DUF1772 domain-containing protein [Quadrisphaera sp. RL12-1S]MBC3761510.1 DUF1772 domain-containing protein [Quadrisphaera sp. RL12-1S]
MSAPAAVPCRTGLTVLATAATGLVAGVHLSGLPLAEALRTLGPADYTTTKRALDVSYPKLMKPLLLASLALLAASLAAQALAERRGTAASSGVALAAGVVVLVAVLRGDLPLNEQVAGWDPLAPPAGWEAVRADWERWFAVRTTASGVAFTAALAALVTAVPAAGRPSTPRGRRTGPGTARS